MIVYVQFSDETKTRIVSAFGSPQDPDEYPFQDELQDDDPRYIAFMNPGATTEGLAYSARFQRDAMLRDIYDTGINIALRFRRLAATAEEISYAESKISELDAFAVALESIPDQPGFPQTIVWPVVPTK